MVSRYQIEGKLPYSFQNYDSCMSNKIGKNIKEPKLNIKNEKLKKANESVISLHFPRFPLFKASTSFVDSMMNPSLRGIPESRRIPVSPFPQKDNER